VLVSCAGGDEGIRLQEDARYFIAEFFPGGWDEFPDSVVSEALRAGDDVYM
jgi:hypothetical protein